MSSSNDISGAQPLVLVVGAHGALGTLVADAVHRRGWALRRSSRDPSRSPGFHHVDLNDPATLPPALDGVDVVITTVPDPALAAELYVLEHGGPPDPATRRGATERHRRDECRHRTGSHELGGCPAARGQHRLRPARPAGARRLGDPWYPRFAAAGLPRPRHPAFW